MQRVLSGKLTSIAILVIGHDQVFKNTHKYPCLQIFCCGFDNKKSSIAMGLKPIAIGKSIYISNTIQAFLTCPLSSNCLAFKWR